MKTDSHTPDPSAATVAAILLALAAAAPSPAPAAETVARGASIGVRSGDYVRAGRTYSNLDLLEQAVRTENPATVRIVWCDTASSRAWMALIARVGDMPLQFAYAEATTCDAHAVSVAARVDAGPDGIDDRAVAEYWNRRMP